MKETTSDETNKVDTVTETFEDFDPKRDDAAIREWIQEALKDCGLVRQAIVVLETEKSGYVLMAGEHHSLERLLVDTMERHDAATPEEKSEDHPSLLHVAAVAVHIVETKRAIERAGGMAVVLDQVLKQHRGRLQ